VTLPYGAEPVPISQKGDEKFLGELKSGRSFASEAKKGLADALKRKSSEKGETPTRRSPQQGKRLEKKTRVPKGRSQNASRKNALAGEMTGSFGGPI